MGTRSKNEYIQKAFYCTAIILLLGCGTRKRQMQQTSTEVKVEATEEGITKNDVQKLLESREWNIKLVPIDPERPGRIGDLEFDNTTINISEKEGRESILDQTVSETKKTTQTETSTEKKSVDVDRDNRWGLREYLILALAVVVFYGLYRIYLRLQT